MMQLWRNFMNCANFKWKMALLRRNCAFSKRENGAITMELRPFLEQRVGLQALNWICAYPMFLPLGFIVSQTIGGRKMGSRLIVKVP